MNIAIVGAQGTGKTSLVAEIKLAQRNGSAKNCFQAEEALSLLPAVTDIPPFKLPPTHTQTIALHQRYALTLLMGLDLPRVATGKLDAQAAHQRASYDAQLRQTLQTHGIAYAVVYGHGQARTDCALQAIAYCMNQRDARPVKHPQDAANAWQWCCDTCSDAACEHRLFTQFIPTDSMRP